MTKDLQATKTHDGALSEHASKRLLAAAGIPITRETLALSASDAEAAAADIGFPVEVLNKSVFRLAPIDKVEAQDMIDELNDGRITGPFRGQAPADRSMLGDILCAMGDMALQHHRIEEIDINPLIISPNGTLTAVDALVVMEGP